MMATQTRDDAPELDIDVDARPSDRIATQLELPIRTIVRVLILLAVLWLSLRLWQFGLQLILAMMLAAALDPAVQWFQRRRLPRPIAVAVVVGIVLGIIALIGFLIVPTLITEATAFATDLPDRVEDYSRILKQNGNLYARIQRSAQGASADPSSLLGGVLAVGQTLVSAVTTAFILVVLTIYILVDGPRIYAWSVRYVPPRHRIKLDKTIPEVSKVVSGYVTGQLFTSALFGIFVFVTLTLVGVPQPLFLSVLAAIADAIPIAGVIIATVPAVLLALTVSPTAAGIVLVAYIAYQQVENYVIVPRVYRQTLQISSFAVLVAVLIGGTLLGVVGVLLALPVAAAIPVVEEIWIPEHHRRKADAREVAALHEHDPTAGWPA